MPRTTSRPPAPAAEVATSGDAKSGDATLDGLMPGIGAGNGRAGFAPAFLLACLRRNAASWLGRARLGQLAAELGTDATSALALLDRAPRPPPALGEAAAWIGRRVPLLHDGRVAWAELFWRPDRAGWRRGLGSFAFRLALPGVGRIELRGRAEEIRLDAVLHVERPLPRAIAFEITQSFGEVLRKLGREGTLNVRSSAEAARS